MTYKRREENRKKGTGRRILFIGLALFIVCGAAAAGILRYAYLNRVYANYETEAGTEVQAGDFLRDDSKKAEFLPESPEFDINVPGEYEVKIKSGIFKYSCTLTIKDTVAPTAEVVDVFIEPGETVGPERFVKNIKDVTEVKVAFMSEPDYEGYGQQAVFLRLTDTSGNETKYEANLIIRPTVGELNLEAGSKAPKLNNFLLIDQKDVELLTALDSIDMKTLGDYNIDIKAYDRIYTTTVHVVDTVPPEITVKDIESWVGSEVQAEDFVKSAKDATPLSYAYATQPDFNREGMQQLTIRVTDAAGNCTEKNVKLNLKRDTEPPVIKGATDLLVYLGETVSYKSGVKVTDNSGGKVTLTVDNSQVDLNTEGTYPVTYEAKDPAGNVASQTVHVIVRARTYDIEEINALCDQVLSEIINDGMSPRDKLWAIYVWAYNNVDYINYTDKSDWKKAAWEALALRKGDCFAFASVSKALITRAGIKNMDIAKIPSKTLHYWNLVDIGEGWYHFDACPRKDNPNLCYVTTEFLMNYSNAHDGSHNYDQSAYPPIN